MFIMSMSITAGVEVLLQKKFASVSS
jgi:hypothetical protein